MDYLDLVTGDLNFSHIGKRITKRDRDFAFVGSGARLWKVYHRAFPKPGETILEISQQTFWLPIDFPVRVWYDPT